MSIGEAYSTTAALTEQLCLSIQTISMEINAVTAPFDKLISSNWQLLGHGTANQNQVAESRRVLHEFKSYIFGAYTTALRNCVTNIHDARVLSRRFGKRGRDRPRAPSAQESE